MQQKHVVADIPPEWRISAESIIIPEKTFINHHSKGFEDSVPLSNIVENDISEIPKVNTEIESLLEFSNDLLKQMKDCRKILKKAELKRREIASSAELLNGVCSSQITEEERLTVFLNGIDKFINFYDNLERISIDFKSPGFTVLSPDFSKDVHKITDGIKFFDSNTNLKNSKLFKLKYLSLQNKAIELVSNHVKSSLERAITLSKNSDAYQKFQTIASSTKRLFRLIENMPRFLDALNVYKKIRVDIIKQQISFTTIEQSIALTFELIKKEYDLANMFLDFENQNPNIADEYKKCFIGIAGDLFDVFSNLYSHELYATYDIVELSQYCSILNSKKISDSISQIPVFTNEIQRRIHSILLTTQERIIDQIPRIAYEVTRSKETIRYLLLIYNSLSQEQFCEPAYYLVSEAIVFIENNGKEFNGSEIERNAYLLSEFNNLKAEIDSIGKELYGDEIEFWNLLHLKDGYHLALLKKFESSITLLYQSIGSAITQFLMNPLFNLKARNSHAVTKQQLHSAMEGISISIDTFFKEDVVTHIKKYIIEQNEKEALLHELKEQLILALGECLSYFPDADEETMADVSSLRKKIISITL